MPACTRSAMPAWERTVDEGRANSRIHPRNSGGGKIWNSGFPWVLGRGGFFAPFRAGGSPFQSGGAPRLGRSPRPLSGHCHAVSAPGPVTPRLALDRTPLVLLHDPPTLGGRSSDSSVTPGRGTSNRGSQRGAPSGWAGRSAELPPGPAGGGGLALSSPKRNPRASYPTWEPVVNVTVKFVLRLEKGFVRSSQQTGELQSCSYSQTSGPANLSAASLHAQDTTLGSADSGADDSGGCLPSSNVPDRTRSRGTSRVFGGRCPQSTRQAVCLCPPVPREPGAPRLAVGSAYSKGRSTRKGRALFSP